MLEELYNFEDSFNAGGEAYKFTIEYFAESCILRHTDIDSKVKFTYDFETNRHVLWIEKIAEIQEKYPELFL